MQATNNIQQQQPQSDSNKELVHYDNAFPELTITQSQRDAQMKQKTIKPCAIVSNVVRESFEIPCSERKSQNVGANGKKTGGSHAQLAGEVSKQYSVDIEINSSKSQSLNIIITGAQDNVAKAKCAVVRMLQTQFKIQMRVDSKYHRFIIGKGGSSLNALERETTTKINVPSGNGSAEPDMITITGPKHGCDAAKSKISQLVDFHSKLSQERLSIPKIYHPFIRGPRRSNIQRWTDQCKVKIDMAPPASPATDICVSGDKRAVDTVLAEIDLIYQKALKETSRFIINVPKSQHRLVFGPKGSGLDEILETTGFSVELPAEDKEEVVLLGPKAKMGVAISMIFTRASSAIREEITAPQRFHKVIIGRNGSALANLLQGFNERVKVEFGSHTGNRIEIEGPAEDVAEVKQRLLTRLQELEQTMAIQTISVPTKYHGLIVGREGANVRRLRDKFNCQISIKQQNMNGTSEIVFEGDQQGIENAVADVRDFIKRLDNEKVKDIIIEPHIQLLLRTPTAGLVPIRAIYEEFPKVVFHWPLSVENLKQGSSATLDPSNQVCKLTGQRQDVDACTEKLVKLMKNINESNYHQEFRVYREFRQSFFSREVRQIIADLSCRIQNPPVGADSDNSSELFWIVGREKQVHDAVDRIDAIQRKLANFKEVRLAIPEFVQSKIVGKEAPQLRSIMEQCDGVSFKFPRAESSTAKEIIVYGPSEAVAKAQQLIGVLNSKVAELCEQVDVPCDPKFHGMLIGRSGQNIAAFREKHSVELLFPNRYEQDPAQANKIRIVGTKKTIKQAEEDLLAQIKTLQDETEVVLPVPQEFMRNVKQAYNKLTDRVRFLVPQRAGKKGTNKEEDEQQAPPQSVDVEVRLAGPKAMVETARKTLKLLVDDLIKYSKVPAKEFPICDKFHARIINRMKNQLPDFEADYRVIIKVALPTRETLDAMANPPIALQNGDHQPAELGKVSIYGSPEQVETVWEVCFRPLLPITVKYDLKKEFHRSLVVVDSGAANGASASSPIKRKPAGKTAVATNDSGFTKAATNDSGITKAAELQKAHEVFVKLPNMKDTEAEYIMLNGTPAQVNEAKRQLDTWVETWELELQDRIARSYEETIQVKNCNVPYILERKAGEWNKQFEVLIRLPRPIKEGDKKDEQANGHAVVENANATSPEEGEPQEAEQDEDQKQEFVLYPADSKLRLLDDTPKEMVLRGHKEKVAQLREVIEKCCQDLDQQQREILNIPRSVHSMLIGAKRSGQLRMQQEYGVQIEFPDRDVQGDNAHIVVVMGPPAKVDQACDFLINRAQDLLEKEERRSAQRGNTLVINGNQPEKDTANKNLPQQKEMIIIGAPWSTPKTDSQQDFPSMNGSS